MMSGALRRLVDQSPEGTTPIVVGGIATTITKVAGLLPVVSFPREAVLDKEHVALAFRVGVGRIKKMDLPVYWIGAQPKYIWGQVLDYMARKAMEHAA